MFQVDEIFDVFRDKMSQNTVKLFKTLISESNKIPDFNFRMYFLRRIKDTFYKGQEEIESNLRGQGEIEKSLARSKISVELIQRQAVVGQLFDDKKTMPLTK